MQTDEGNDGGPRNYSDVNVAENEVECGLEFKGEGVETMEGVMMKDMQMGREIILAMETGRRGRADVKVEV